MTRVLVVEDEGIVALGIQRLLHKLGYETLGPEATGQGAIDAATRDRPDVVLMDVRLQGPMDGTEAARRIRAATGAPIIFLSAYSDDETLGRATGADPFGYLTKPIDERDLHTTLQVTLYRRAAELAQQMLEQERAGHLKAIRQQVAELDRFAQRVAKELQSPLGEITVLARDIEQQTTAAQSSVASQLRAIRATATQLRDSIDASLQYAHVGWHEPTATTVSCDKALNDAVARIEMKLAAARARLKRGPLPKVRGDAELLSLLFENLLRWTMSKQHGEGAPIVLEAREGADGVTFTTTFAGDDLTGSERAILDRPGPRETEIPAGGELALAIFARAVARQSGTVHARRDEAQNVVTFTLPRATGP